MEAHDIDVLVLGRQANVRYVTGAPQLWIGGTRPFGPVCVMLRGTGEIYLMSTDDEGVPEEIGRDRLYGLAWNPMTFIDVLKNIDGSSAAKRVGTDAITPTFATLLPMAFPTAEFVDGELPMLAARRTKTTDEVAAMSTAVRVAEAGVAAAVGELRPGLTEQTLAGAVLEAMAAGGVSTPATQDAAWVTSREHPWRRADGGGEVRSGDLIAFCAGALADGYVAEVARTWPVGEATDATRKLYRRSNMLWDRLITACRAGVGPAICLPPTTQPASRRRRWRSRTGWASASTRRWSPDSCRSPPTPSGWMPGWCWRSPATSGRRVLVACCVATPSPSPTTGRSHSPAARHGLNARSRISPNRCVSQRFSALVSICSGARTLSSSLMSGSLLVIVAAASPKRFRISAGMSSSQAIVMTPT